MAKKSFFRTDRRSATVLRSVGMLGMALTLALGACSTGGDYDPTVTTSLPAAFIGAKPSLNFVNVFEKRLLNKSASINEYTKIVVIHDEHISSLMPASGIAAAVRAVYDRGGVIVIIEPTSAKSKILTDAINHPSAISDDAGRHSADIYAFNNQGAHYFLGDIHPDVPQETTVIDEYNTTSRVEGTNADLTGEEYGNIIDTLIAWINKNAGGAAARAANDPVDVTKTFNYFSILQIFPITVSGELAHVALSSPDTLTRSGFIQVDTQYYPLHAFDGQASPGDYYVMHQEVTIPNALWYKSPWTNTHGGVHVRLCAFFMQQFSLTNSFSDGSVIALTPTPLTTIGQTTYVSGMSWTVGGSITGGYASNSGQLVGSFNAGATYTNTQSRTISDIDIQNMGDGKNAAWQLKFNNLTSYNNNMSINEPASASRSTQVLYTDWVWRMPGATDAATNAYTMTVNLTGTKWGGSKFYSSKADFGTKSFTPSIAAQSATITPPNRKPTSALNVINDTTGYVNGFDIWAAAASSDTDAPAYSQSATLGKDEAKAVWLLLGTYKARIRIGNTYYYSTRNFNLNTRGETTDTHAGNTGSGGDFTSTKPGSW